MPTLPSFRAQNTIPATDAARERMEGPVPATDAARERMEGPVPATDAARESMEGAGVGLELQNPDSPRSHSSQGSGSKHFASGSVQSGGSHSSGGSHRSAGSHRSVGSHSEVSPQYTSEEVRVKPTRTSQDMDLKITGAQTTPLQRDMHGKKQRKPCCASVDACCRGNYMKIMATSEEMAEILEAMRHLELKKEVVVGGELLVPRSHLLKIGKRWKRRGLWESNEDIINGGRLQMRECIEEEAIERLIFQIPSRPYPWVITLKYPCRQWCTVVLLIFALLGVGIDLSSFEIDTNFDSFMDSDSTSSTYYNAYLEAIKDRDAKKKGRRLQATLPVKRSRIWRILDPIYDPGATWSAFEDMAYEPTMDDHGHWSPSRYLAKTVFGDHSFSFRGRWATKPQSEFSRANSTDGSSPPRRLVSFYKLYQIQITYASNVAGKSILQNSMIADVHRIETKIKAIPEWKELCDGAQLGTEKFCAPGVSFINIAFAERIQEAIPLPWSVKTGEYCSGNWEQDVKLIFTAPLAECKLQCVKSALCLAIVAGTKGDKENQCVLCSSTASFDSASSWNPKTYVKPRQEQDVLTKLHFNGLGTKSLPLDLAVSFASKEGLLELLFPIMQVKAAAEKDGKYEVEGLACFDLDKLCSKYKLEGHCEPFAAYETYMHTFCRNSCNFCGTAEAYSNSSSTGGVDMEVVDSIRSSFRFQTYCCESEDPSRRKEAAKLEETYMDFVAKLVSLLKTEQDGSLRVFYQGDKVETYEAMAAVSSDLMYAVGSYAFVLFYATLHTRSVFIATFGLFLVMLSIPSALAIYSLVSGSNSVSLMSCLSIFIVIGLGSDMLFVYTDFWKQSLQHSRDPVKRLKFTYAQAATSTAATTFTTAMSFLANLASALRPLREFGFFMGACVVMAWLIMLFACPPLLIMGERCHRRLRYVIVGMSKDCDEDSPRPRSSLRASVAAVPGFKRASMRFAAMLDPEKGGVGDSHGGFLGQRFAELLSEWKCCLIVVFAALTVGSAYMSYTSFEQAQGAPQVFQPDHNQVLGKKLDAQFNTFDPIIANKVGNYVNECNDLFESCAQFRFESSGRSVGTPTDCACYLHGDPTGTCDNPYSVRVSFRVLGRTGLPLDAVKDADWINVVRTQFPNSTYPGSQVKRQTSLFEDSKCWIENWNTGQQMLASMVSAGDIEATGLRGLFPGEAASVCRQNQICYCGMARVRSDVEGSNNRVGFGTLKLENLETQTSRRLRWEEAARSRRHPLSDMYTSTAAVVKRRTQEEEAGTGNIKPGDLVDVSLVLGMKVVGDGPLLGVAKEKLYQFDPSFNIQDPKAQRRFASLCENMRDKEDLKIGQTRCWLLGFRDHWIAKGNEWPVRPERWDMHQEVYDWASNVMTDGFQTTIFFWFEGTRTMATHIVFFLSVSKHISADEAITIKTAWDDYVDEFNSVAESSITGIFHASKLWVRAEAEKVILDSTLVTLGISLGCVFLGIVLFTRSVHLAFIVMVVVMSIIICLLFFMTVIMKWPIGAIEVLSLIVFVGFAVDYCLHIAHKYHSCHITNVADVPPPPEEEDMHIAKSNSQLSIEDFSPEHTAQTADFHPRPRGGSLTSTSSVFGFHKRVSTIQIKIADKPNKRLSQDDRQNSDNFELLASNHPEERYARSRYALERMGGSVVGSAFTTAGCAAFLLPCQLAIFTKIGSVVMAVTIYAIVYTILPLPALLMICGPCSNDCGAIMTFCCFARGKMGKQEPKTEHVEKEERQPPVKGRLYVLHMPTRAMGAVGPGIPSTRTRVTASG